VEIDVTARQTAGARSEHGSDAPTRQRVARTLLELGPSSAATLAERLALTPAAIRRHLDHLVETGLAESRVPRVSAVRGRGRPAKLFALTAAGRDLFEQQYDDLAAQALRFLADTAGEEAVSRFAEQRLSDLESRIAALQAAQPELTPAQALAAGMSDAGYAATLAPHPVGAQLCQQHCPVAHVAHEFPQLCEAETALISRIVGGHVQRLATIAHGDGVCTTVIPDYPGLRERSPSSTDSSDHSTTTAAEERH
jgi:predicted ArsR family transcriptional regulator